MSFRHFLITLVCGILIACGADTSAPKPAPTQPGREDTGYFCGMIVADHTGPKSQIFLRGELKPLWFTTARDGIAFQRLPEETRPIHVFYVSAVDLGGWDHPEADTDSMIEADRAWFVIESEKSGSMGAPETIPFSSRPAAEAFAAQHGGRVLQLDDIPVAYVLGPDEGHAAGMMMDVQQE